MSTALKYRQKVDISYCGDKTGFPRPAWSHDLAARSRHTLEWLSLVNLIKHCAVNSMFCHYANSDCAPFNPPNEFGSNHSYDTWTLLW